MKFGQVMGKLQSFLRPASDFTRRVTARNSVNFHPISKNKVPWYSRDRDLTVEHPQSWFWPIFRYDHFRWPYLGVASRRRNQRRNHCKTLIKQTVNRYISPFKYLYMFPWFSPKKIWAVVWLEIALVFGFRTAASPVRYHSYFLQTNTFTEDKY